MAILQVYQRQLEVAMQKFGDIVSEGNHLYRKQRAIKVKAKYSGWLNCRRFYRRFFHHSLREILLSLG